MNHHKLFRPVSRKYRITGLLLSFLVSGGMHAQNSFYLDLSGNWPFISKNEAIVKTYLPLPPIGDTKLTAGVTATFDGNPGFGLGAGISKHLSERVSLNTGIRFTFYSFRKETTITFIETTATPGQPEGGVTGDNLHIITIGGTGRTPGTASGIIIIQPGASAEADASWQPGPNLGKTKLLYLTIPVTGSYALLPDRLNLGIGVNNHFMVSASEIKSGLNNEYADKSRDPYHTYQLDGIFTIECRIVSRLWIETSYNHGLRSMHKKPTDTLVQIIKSARYKTIDLGLKYTF